MAGVLLLATDPFKLQRTTTWIAVAAMLVLFLIATGHGLTGRADGALIDARNRMSLSRLQLVAWTLLVVSAVITAGFWNVAHGTVGLDFKIPEELWALLGISTGSLVASHLVIKPQDPNAPDPTKAGSDRNATVNDAQWRDLIQGEAKDNASYVDLSRVQMLFFSLAVIAAYAYALNVMFGAVDPTTNALASIKEFPTVSDGMVALIAISHAGYLARKAV
jgi:hypothetical protein